MEEKNLQNEPMLLDDGGCASSEPFALRVLGDSMEPEFPDGCIVIIEPNAPAKSGSYVLAETPEVGYIFRQLVIEDERYLLKPLKDGYPVIEVQGTSTIKGLIIQRSGTRRRNYKRYI